MARKRGGLRRITAKQRAARRRNIKIAQRYAHMGSRGRSKRGGITAVQRAVTRRMKKGSAVKYLKGNPKFGYSSRMEDTGVAGVGFSTYWP